MQVVYYYDEYEKSCPVKRYFQYTLIIGISKDRSVKVLSDIDAKIQAIRDNDGLPAISFSKPLHGYHFFEILNPKNSDTVIRITYFRQADKMVLLHAFEKPSQYKAQKEKKAVIKEYDISQRYMDRFKLKPDNYEKYE